MTGYELYIKGPQTRTVFDFKGDRKAVAAMVKPHFPHLPTHPNTYAAEANAQLMWIGPDHWLLVAPWEDEAVWETELTPQKATKNCSLHLVSDSWAFFEITGNDAAITMNIASTLDFDPSVFAPDAASFTEAFGTKALVTRLSNGFILAVEQSYGEYVRTFFDKIID